MPQIISDTSYQPGIVNQDRSIFDWPNAPAPSILSYQVNPTQPLPDRTSTATGLLCPDLHLMHRLAAFVPQIWTLTAGSLLVRLMSVLLGPAGAGQLRQRQLIARLQSAVAGTHFYDLDAFYGALFSARRTAAAALPVNPATGTTFDPYSDLATQDGWDQIRATDAIYRERVIQLARAISMGGTHMGIQAMAEAIVRVPCRVYETGQLITLQGAESTAGNTWGYIQQAYPAWTSFTAVGWSQLQAIVSYGGMAINAINEVVIQPQKTYAPGLASQQEAVADASGILDVVSVLAPAFALLSVDTSGGLVYRPVPVAGLSSDADYWEVIAKVTPPDPQAPPYVGYRLAYDRDGKTIVDFTLPMKPGVPAFSQSQGVQYSYASSVAQSFSSTWEPVVSRTAVLTADKADTRNFETVHFPGGKATAYVPAWGLIDPVTAAAGRAAAPGGTVAAPYSGPRAPVVTHG